MAGLTDQGAERAAFLNEQSPLAFRGRLRKEGRLSEVTREANACSDCGGSIEEGRRKLGLPRCRKCAFK